MTKYRCRGYEMKRSVEDAIDYIRELVTVVKPDFTGRVELNFFEGGVTNWNRTESIKPKK